VFLKAIQEVTLVLKAEALSQIYQERPVLRGFSFTFGAAGIYGIIGPNGAGKSTLLRLITGMEKPLSGRVFYRGVELTQPNPEIACVWQRPYLFQTTVAENIGYGLRIRHWARDARRVRVAHLLQAFRLQSLENQAAPKISVGEAARVALARAIAPRPQVLSWTSPPPISIPVTRAWSKRSLRRSRSRKG